MPEPIPGKRYRHFKGGRYDARAVRTDVVEVWVKFSDGSMARLTDPPMAVYAEPFVHYVSLADESAWARPLSSWTAPVEDGSVRFALEN